MLADRARPGPGGRSMVAASASALGRPAPIDQDLQQGLHDVQALLQLHHALAQGLDLSAGMGVVGLIGRAVIMTAAAATATMVVAAATLALLAFLA